MQWKMDYAEHHNNASAANMFLMRFESEIWLRFQLYKVPAIELTQRYPARGSLPASRRSIR